MKQSLGLLNCTPPWMTENENLWCQNALNLTRDQESEVEILLSNIINERGKEGKCFPSCKTAWYLEFHIYFMFMKNCVLSFRYMSDQTGFDARKDRYGMYVTILPDVEVTRTLLNIEPMTLMTRIGGIIGVGKELLWVIIFFSSSFLLIFKRVSHFK